MKSETEIAIVGIGAILPDALDVPMLWRNLLARHSSLRPVPRDLWDEDHYYAGTGSATDRTRSRLGGLVRGFRFSAREFGIPPSVDIELDITQKAALVAARTALAEIGIHGATGGVRGAVIIGNAMGGMHARAEGVLSLSHRLIEATLDRLPSLANCPAEQRAQMLAELRQGWHSQFRPFTSNTLPGALGNMMAARIAHYFNLHGPTFTVDAACASSMAAIESAVWGLRSGRYDLALAGGVDFATDPTTYVTFSRMSALSDTGSYPFDARANGFVMGEGAVLFALKRLRDAQLANDHVYALIEGIGSSSDGRGSSIVAPNERGQRLALRAAYADAEVSPAQIGYLEAHGTATPIGDPVEILALRKVFRGCPRSSIALGSIKANLGHLKAAAGAAGILRATLALDTGVIPPQANFETSNERCKLETSPFYIPTEPCEWPSTKTHAAVSAFGFGGINYHCVLRRAPDIAHPARRARRDYARVTSARLSAREHGVMAFGADSVEALLEVAQSLSRRLSRGDALAEVMRDCKDPQDAPMRIAFFASQAQEAVQALTLIIAALRGDSSEARLNTAGIFWRSSPPLKGDAVAMMFPGQGSQYLGMLAELRQVFPTIDATLTEADAILANVFKQPLSSYFAAVASESQAERAARFAALSQTEVLQPALVACNEALRRTLLQFGAPTVAFGHSLGEISACIAAGVMSFEDGLRFAAERGRRLAQAGGTDGCMLQAAAGAEDLEKVLGGWPEGITVANKNCTRQTVLGGGTAAVTAVKASLQRSGIDSSILPVSQAFHTPLMESAVAPLRTYLQALQLSPPRLTLLSSISGQSAPKDTNSRDWFAAALSRQVVQPVEFIETLRQAFAAGARLFLEVGPKQALSGFARDVLGTSDIDVIACCSPKDGERRSFGRTLALLVASGVIPGHVRSLEELQTAPVIPRSPVVPAFVTPVPVDAATPASTPGQPWQTLDQVADSPEFWQFLASQAQSLMKGAIASWRSGGPMLTSAANTSPASASPAGLAASPASATRSPVKGSLEWRLEWIAQSLQYSVSELKLDAALEDDLGVDSARQCDILRDLARALGRKPPAVAEHQGYANLRSLLAALDALPELDEATPAEPVSSTEVAEPVAVSSVIPLHRATPRATDKPSQRPERGVLSPIGEQILSTLMERTGYTRAELQLDAHLEQVLGIDSIAQLEIIAVLQDKLQLPMDESFRVANYPTLGKLIAYVEGKLAGVSAPAPTPAPASVANTVAVEMKGLEAPFYCRQLAFEPLPPFTRSVSRGSLLILHDGSAPTLETRLGGSVVSFAAVSTHSLQEALARNPDTLVVIASAPEVSDTAPLNAACDATTKVFHLGQALFKVAQEPLPVVLVVGAQTDSPASEAWKGAWVAAWKSLCREWSRRKDFGSRDLRILELTGPIDPQVEPLLTAVGHDGPLEARLDATGAWTYPVLRKAPARLDSFVRDTPVAVITGGARGITAVIAKTLFETTACKLVLIGRTSPAEDGAPFDLVSEREIVRQALGPDATLPEISSAVEMRRRAAEVAQTLRALREAGADPDYLTLDVAREGELAKALEFARSRYGRIDWVIHGAGRDSSSALLSKSADGVLPVLQPKLAGLEPSDEVADKPAWIALSSVSARFGNGGQLEYAAANEAMARVVLAGGGLVLDFGPWRDTGMAATMVNLFKAGGVDALASREAAQTAVALIVGGAKGEFVLAGRLGRSIGKLAGQNVALELDVPGAEYTATLTLEYERLAWLRDHTWRGTGLVPAVVSLAMMIDAAQGCEPSAPVTVVRSFHLDRPAIARPMRPLNLVIHAERTDRSHGNDAIAVSTCVQAAGKPIHAATVCLGTAPEPTAEHRENECLMPVRHSLPRQEIYRKAFHGASFQVLESVDIGDGWAVGESVALGEHLGADLPSHCRLAAMAREVVLQTVGAYLGVTVGEVALPEAFSELRIHGAPEAGKRVRTRIQVRSASDANPGFDVRLYSEEGRLIEVMEDLRFRRTGVALSLETAAIISTKVA